MTPPRRRAWAALAVCACIAGVLALTLGLTLHSGRHHSQGSNPPAVDGAEQVVTAQAVPSLGARSAGAALNGVDVVGAAAAFVRIGADLQFELACRRFVVAGFNGNDLSEVAMVNIERFNTVGGKSGRRLVRETLAQARGMGLNVLRTWAHTSDPKFPFQVAPGIYAESGLRALDFVLHTAAQHGIHVILSLADNWKYYNGVDQYVDWSTTAPPRLQRRPPDLAGDPKALGGSNEHAMTASYNASAANNTSGSHAAEAAAAEAAAEAQRYEAERHALFFTDEGARQLYRNHAATLTGRRNSFNGLLYRNDPVIMAWDLANEIRCDEWAAPQCAPAVQAWVEEMSAHVKLLAPHQLLAVGSEGFFGASTPSLQQFNPGPWASVTGQDFLSNTAAPHVDFATLHMWPDNWEVSTTQYGRFLKAWLSSHVRVAQQLLGKPLLLEEFGKGISPDEVASPQAISLLRNPVFGDTYRALQRLFAAHPGDQVSAAEANTSSTDYITRALGSSDSIGADSDSGGQTALAGSLFWKWQVPVFINSTSDDYAIYRDDTTMDIIQAHATFVQQLVASGAPLCRPACWVAGSAAAATQARLPSTTPPSPVVLTRRCILQPEACQLGWQSPSAAPPCPSPALNDSATTAACPQSPPGPDDMPPERGSTVSLLVERLSAGDGEGEEPQPSAVLYLSPHRNARSENITALLDALANSTSARGLHLWAGAGFNQVLPSRLGQVYASQAACCAPNLGAFQAGCGP